MRFLMLNDGGRTWRSRAMIVIKDRIVQVYAPIRLPLWSRLVLSLPWLRVVLSRPAQWGWKVKCDSQGDSFLVVQLGWIRAVLSQV